MDIGRIIKGLLILFSTEGVLIPLGNEIWKKLRPWLMRFREELANMPIQYHQQMPAKKPSDLQSLNSSSRKVLPASAPGTNSQVQRFNTSNNTGNDKIFEQIRKDLADMSTMLTDIFTTLTTAEEQRIRQDPLATEWYRILAPPSINLIIGDMGSGKTCTAHYLLEVLHAFEPHKKYFMVEVEGDRRKHLPSWLKTIPDINKAPDNSVILLDEAHLVFHARESLSASSRKLFSHLALTRQRDLTEIFVSQRARAIDIDIVDLCTNIIIKEPGMLQDQTEKGCLKEVISQALGKFAEIKDDRRAYNYVKAKHAKFQGMIKNKKASYWNEDLSKAYVISPSTETIPDIREPEILKKKKTEAEVACDLYSTMRSLRQVASKIGISKSKVHYLIQKRCPWLLQEKKNCPKRYQ